MFFERTTILFITSCKIRAAAFSGKDFENYDEKIYDWDKDKLGEVIMEIARHSSKKIRVVFGEEFSYTSSISYPGKDRSIVKSQAEEIIPEKMIDNWDFQVKDDKSAVCQVAVIQQKYIDLFQEKFLSVGLKPELIEPESIALSRIMPQSGFYLFISKNEKFLVGAVKDGVVVSTYLSPERIDEKMLNEFLDCLEKKFSSLPEKVFIGAELKDETDFLPGLSLPMEAINLNPMISAARKIDITGDDAKILNIKTGKPRMVIKDKEKIKNKFPISKREIILTVIFTVFLLAILFLVFVLPKI